MRIVIYVVLNNNMYWFEKREYANPFQFNSKYFFKFISVKLFKFGYFRTITF